MPAFSPSPLLYPQPTLRPGVRAVGEPAAPKYGFAFFMFILVNAALFVRPADIIPDLAGVEIYQFLILTCFAFAFPAVLGSLSPTRLEARPIDLYVLLLLPAVALSLYTHGNLGELYDSCFKFFKIVIYYLLLVSLVTTPKRLRTFLACLAAFAALTALLSALDFHKIITLPRAPSLDAHGRLTIDPNRMYGPGIFADPNDVCVLIVTASLIVMGQLADRRLGSGRWLWLIAVAIFGYGFYLTQSRGGLLALFAGLGVFIGLRFGWRNAFLLSVPLFVGIAGVLGARQAGLSMNAETGQERIQLWNAGLDMVRHNPLFGIGWDHYGKEAGHVAHNSFMNALGETGLFGGSLFLGVFFLAVWGTLRISRPTIDARGQKVWPKFLDADLQQLYPYMAGAVVAYTMGMMSLTLNERVTTYSMLGIASVFQHMVRLRPARVPLKFELTQPLVFLGVSVLYLTGVFVFIRLFLKV